MFQRYINYKWPFSNSKLLVYQRVPTPVLTWGGTPSPHPFMKQNKSMRLDRSNIITWGYQETEEQQYVKVP